VTPAIGPVEVVDEAVVTLFTEAVATLATNRGGARLWDDLRAVTGADGPEELAHALVERGWLVDLRQAGELVGLLAVRADPPPTILGIYVRPAWRRRGSGLLLLRSVQAAVVDAWVLPGDRATKSLYEKVGWKARRLTMSGE
jgi:GNAT superfamily N-acetyltransferase